MDRFINQQAVFDTVCRLCGKRGTCNPDICGYIEAFRDIPVIDAVPVVRCKDCKHSEHWYGDKRRCFLWHETGIDVFEDGYCNYAERKDRDL